ncbi:MAG: high-affinity iron transporter [Chloroflexi bacterium]|nr:high-affinity iron transporter [Chloroflexota bacterium]
MIAAGIITFREGLEAALIVGIVLGYLKKAGDAKSRRLAWLGVILAVASSIALAALLQAIGAELQGRLEQIFEGTTMLLAALILTWMIFWMRNQAYHIREGLEQGLRQAIASNASWGILGLTFLAVFREGVETALFLSAAAFSNTGSGLLEGSVLGLILAAGVGWGFYRAAARMDLGKFFDVTSVLLLLFAAGLVAHGIHEFQEAALFPTLVAHVWDTNAILDENSFVGLMLKSLFGYNGNPSLLEVIAYVGYYAIILSSIRWWTTRLALSVVKE